LNQSGSICVFSGLDPSGPDAFGAQATQGVAHKVIAMSREDTPLSLLNDRLQQLGRNVGFAKPGRALHQHRPLPSRIRATDSSNHAFLVRAQIHALALESILTIEKMFDFETRNASASSFIVGPPRPR
jgi:hypothetical protein